MIKEEDIDRIAEWTRDEIGLFSPVPVIWDTAKLKEFIAGLKPVQEEKPENDN